ncbi:MAG: serine hydrolase [Betaproteobacteria bacterium]|nr:serine hydrolase [Betaproteobacteria bacterium]MDH5285972.1 serine hydrolase [Betaproteobacteria bacterium]
MRRALAAAAAVAATLAWACAAHGALADRFPGAAAAYLVIADGQPLWAAEPDKPLPSASLTKLMTALVVAESARGESVVTVSRTAARATGARMGLAAGARLSVDDLLAGLLLRSGNDACVALAEHVAGSEAQFVARMNERARAWGLSATRYANACGFDAPGHHASARDLAALARRVLAVPGLARLVALEKLQITGADGRRYALANTNLLFGVVQGLAGVKTGYTSRAGHCLVAYAKRDGRDVLVVLLRGADRWWDAVAMIEQAFDPRLTAAPRAPKGG